MWICKISCFRSIKKLIGQLFKIFETLTVSMNSLFECFISVICFYLLSAVLLWTGNVFSRGRESPKRQSGDWPHTCTHGCMWKVWPEGGARGHVMYVTKTLQWILWGLWSHFIITTHIYFMFIPDDKEIHKETYTNKWNYHTHVQQLWSSLNWALKQMFVQPQLSGEAAGLSLCCGLWLALIGKWQETSHVLLSQDKLLWTSSCNKSCKLTV